MGPKEKFYNVVSRITMFQGVFLMSQAPIPECWMQARYSSFRVILTLAFGIGSSHLPSQEVEAKVTHPATMWERKSGT